MSDQDQPGAPEGTPKAKGKVHPAAIAGPFVAIGASLLAVFISSNNNREDEQPAPPAEISTDGNVSVQSASSDQPPGTPTPPDPGAQTASPDGDVTVSLTLPPGLEGSPIVAALRQEAEATIAKFRADAAASFAEAKANGQTPMPWELEITWKEIARSGDIVSLEGGMYTYTGGAHPITGTETVIARTGKGDRLTLDNMLQFIRMPSPAIVIATCEGLKALKKESIGSETIMEEPIVCAGPNSNLPMAGAKIALAPSDQAGKFGGLYVYFDPYAVGPYVEGPYTVTVQQAVFAADLRPEFKSYFAGNAPVLSR